MQASPPLALLLPATSTLAIGGLDSSSLFLEDEVKTRLVAIDQSFAKVPEYENVSRHAVMGRVRAVAASVADVVGSPSFLGLDDALAQTLEFVGTSFDQFEGKASAIQRDWVFAVPARTSRSSGSHYASEITPFLPVLDPKFGVSADVRQRAIVGLAPSVIETYATDKACSGALVYAPLHDDVHRDYARAADRLRVSRRAIQATAEFARGRLGARVMGLGAVIPSLTSYGRDVRVGGLTVTTGHGGTVYLLVETVKAVVDRASGTTAIGVIGAAGAIGRASLCAMSVSLPGTRRYLVSDMNQERLRALVASNPTDRDLVASTNRNVLRECDVIVSAVTSPIDLDAPEYADVELEGKVIVDDSQPGCFSREQVEARGGKLVWVVGSDSSDAGFATRENGYRFGEAAGLWRHNSVWGCEAEAASIAVLGRTDLAIMGPVTPTLASSVGDLCRDVGISASESFESFGRPVAL